MENSDRWLSATVETINGYRRMIDAAIFQLSDEEFSKRPAEGMNSVAVILRHLGGNLLSRWTDFLTTDGEKSNRNRDEEFVDWPGDRDSLLAYFDSGWEKLLEAVKSLSTSDLARNVTIRGEQHTVQQAILRSITHIAYHVGQIMLVARFVHSGSWQWLTIPPGGSGTHNRETWGTAASRGASGGVSPIAGP